MTTPFGTIDAETAGLNRTIERAAAGQPHPTTLSPAEQRRAREEGRSVFGDIVTSDRAETMTIPGPGGPLDLRCFIPARPEGIYLHMHGGGWVVGATHHQDARLEAMADATGAVVLSIDYRLSPEHPYPAGPDDCESAAVWVHRHGAAEFGVEPLVLGGESAGGHLAAVTAVRLRDRHGLDDLAGVNLVYGVFDLRMTPSMRLWGERPLVIDTPTISWYVEQFLDGTEGAADDPDVSPLLADLGGLPPALFTVGTEDPLLDDTLFMHARWHAAGNPSALQVLPGGAHAFDAFGSGIAETALGRMRRFVGSCFAGRPDV